jgi:uncharacterized protein YdaU (DUF1376 family)
VSHKDPWFKFFNNLWRAGTRRLSFEEKGLYVDLIVLWRDGQVVPNDAAEIAAELGVRDRRTVARPLAGLLARGKVRVGADGNLYNDKVEDDLAARAEQRALRPRQSGQKDDQEVLRFPPRLVRKFGDK